MANPTSRTSGTSEAWVLRQPARPRASMRLLCIPHAGGNAWMFRQWACRMPEEIEVCGVQLPGHVGRFNEAPSTHFATLLARLGDGLRPEMEMPVALFGHSLGALLAFELARQMRQRSGAEPLHLFVSGHNAPHVPDDLEDVAGLDDDALVARLRDLGCTPEAVLQDRETMQLMLPILRADFAVYSSYAYRDGQPLGCPITVFHGLADPQTNRAGIEGWRRHTTGPCRVQPFPGDHFFAVAQEAIVVQTIRLQIANC